MTLPLTTYTHHCYTRTNAFADGLKTNPCKSSVVMKVSIADTIALQTAKRRCRKGKERKCYLWHMGAGAPQIGE